MMSTIHPLAENPGQRDANAPDKTAVEQKGHQCFTPGTKGKIGGIGVCAERHKQRPGPNEMTGQSPHRVCGVVNHGEQLGNRRQGNTKAQAKDNGEGNQLPVRTAHLLRAFPSAQLLTDENAHCVPHSQIRNVEHIANGAGNVGRRHHIQTSQRIALIQNCHSAGPERLVD